MISLLKNLISSSNSEKYQKQWNYENFIGQELASLTIGIVGFGRLGKMMAKFCDSFGMRFSFTINMSHLKSLKMYL